LIDKDGIIQISDLISPEDFYDPNNGLIYKSMLDLLVQNRPIDLLTVGQLLDDRNQLEAVGGNMAIIELTNSVFTSANIYQYAQIIKNKSVLRKLIKSGNDILLHGYDEEMELNKLLEKAEQSLFSVTQTFIKNKLVHIRDIINLRYDEFAEIHENPELATRSRIVTNFNGMDNKTG
jgi:replicative DNA helicase